MTIIIKNIIYSTKQIYYVVYHEIIKDGSTYSHAKNSWGKKF